MTLGLLATGDELTHGDTLNTSTQVIAKALSSEGFSIGMHVVCGDKEQELLDALSFLGTKHQVLIITGGLGPTSDDRTRFGLSSYLEQPLIAYADALLHIETRLTQAKLLMNEGNRQQALFPAGAELFPNPNGTAMGCAYQRDGQLFLLLPGPPKECMPMFQNYALPFLKKIITSSQKEILTWRLFGVPEGQIAEVLEHALTGITCQFGYCVETPYLIFKVRCEKEDGAKICAVIEPLVAAYIIASPEQTASTALLKLLETQTLKITIFDEVTGGALQCLLQKPQNYTHLSFREKKSDEADVYFHATGLEAYWQNASEVGNSDVVLRYRAGEQEGVERYTLPRIGAWAQHTAAEWLSFRIAHLINQIHDRLT